jgi:hypothetical protein
LAVVHSAGSATETSCVKRLVVSRWCIVQASGAQTNSGGKSCPTGYAFGYLVFSGSPAAGMLRALSPDCSGYWSSITLG